MCIDLGPLRRPRATSPVSPLNPSTLPHPSRPSPLVSPRLVRAVRSPSRALHRTTAINAARDRPRPTRTPRLFPRPRRSAWQSAGCSYVCADAGGAGQLEFAERLSPWLVRQGVLRTRDRLGIDSTSRRLSTCCARLLASGFASLPFRVRFPSIPSTRHPQDAFSRAAPLPWAVAFIPRPRYLSLPPTFLGFQLARAAAFLTCAGSSPLDNLCCASLRSHPSLSAPAPALVIPPLPLPSRTRPSRTSSTHPSGRSS